MKVVIPVWHERVAPVFSTFDRLVLFEMQDDTLVPVQTIDLDKSSESQRILTLVSLDISLLICGAIPFRYERELQERGIEVIPFVAGNISEVAEAYCSDTLTEPRFRMPGCKNREQKKVNCRYYNKGGHYA